MTGKPLFQTFFAIGLTAALALTSCGAADSAPPSEFEPLAQSVLAMPEQTPLPVRKPYAPGELVEYTAQDGDTLPALAARFNTSVEEILAANPFIPRDATTMPPGMPMQIPIYFRALWAIPFKILPDHAFVNGPSVVGFNIAAFVAAQPGWLKTYSVYAGGKQRSGAEMVEYVSVNYSVNPKLLLALLEYQGGALTQAEPPVRKNLLGFNRRYWENHYLQLVLAANTLNNGYYGWRAATLLEFEDGEGILIRPDPWQNAASVAMQYYFSRVYTGEQYKQATGPDGLFKTYRELFGDPWQEQTVLIPGSLRQPDLILPFPQNQVWSYTGGPHTGWGTGEPLAAIDFAPPDVRDGCVVEDKFTALAAADGLVARSSVDGVALDLDKDGDERTGWVIYYLHLATRGRAPVGAELKAGDPIGYPSCEGGHATGTHQHIARKYNGEWIAADGVIPFNLEGWVAHNGARPYLGTLTKGAAVVTACECGDLYTSISRNYP